MMAGWGMKTWAAGLATLLLAWWWMSSESQQQSGSGACGPMVDHTPYASLGVSVGADSAAVKKAYRKLALRWHPDKPTGDKCTFAGIANAYDVLSDPFKKDLFDRLGQDGLRRLRDGDPSVQPGYVPPEPKELIDRLIGALNFLNRWLRASLDRHVKPTVIISATDSADNELTSGSVLIGGVATFKFTLSQQPFDRSFEALTNLKRDAITHNCGKKARFLGMKKVYYLECPHIPEAAQGGEDTGDRIISVRIVAGAFVSRAAQFNEASSTFTLLMG